MFDYHNVVRIHLVSCLMCGRNGGVQLNFMLNNVEWYASEVFVCLNENIFKFLEQFFGGGNTWCYQICIHFHVLWFFFCPQIDVPNMCFRW